MKRIPKNFPVPHDFLLQAYVPSHFTIGSLLRKKPDARVMRLIYRDEATVEKMNQSCRDVPVPLHVCSAAFDDVFQPTGCLNAATIAAKGPNWIILSVEYLADGSKEAYSEGDETRLYVSRWMEAQPDGRILKTYLDACVAQDNIPPPSNGEVVVFHWESMKLLRGSVTHSIPRAERGFRLGRTSTLFQVRNIPIGGRGYAISITTKKEPFRIVYTERLPRLEENVIEA